MQVPDVALDKFPHSLVHLSAGESGAIISSAGAWRLQGSFHLVFNGRRSKPVVFGDANQATVSEHTSPILVGAQVGFDYSPALDLRAGSEGPWLRSNQVRIIRDGVDADTLVDLRYASVSLLPDELYGPPHVLLYPGAAGPASGKLWRGPHPTQPSYNGYFLLRDEQGFAVFVRGLEDSVDIQTPGVDAVAVRLRDDCVLRFPVGSQSEASAQPLVFRPNGGVECSALRFGNESELIGAPVFPGNGSKVPVRELRVSGPRLRVAEFSSDEFVLARRPKHGSIADTELELRTSRERLGFSLPLTAEANASDPSEFIYRDPDVDDDAVPTRFTTRFLGLIVNGLPTSHGHALRLDSKELRISLVGGTFHFSGKLVPKPNHRTNPVSRGAKIPVGGFVLSLNGGTSKSPAGLRLDTQTGEIALSGATLSGRPAGFAAHVPGEERFSSWDLRPQSDSLVFKLKGGKVEPKGGARWLEEFKTERRAPHALVEHPGVGISIDGDDVGAADAGLRTIVTTSQTTIDGKPKEILIYSAFVGFLSYKAAVSLFGAKDIYKELTSGKVSYTFRRLNEATSKAWVKSNVVDGLVIALQAENPLAKEELKRLIDENYEAGTGSGSIFIWPMIGSVGLMLADKRKPEAPEYCFDAPSKTTGWLFDFSAEQASDPEHLGFESFAKLAKHDPHLWPRRNDQPGARFDPSSRYWRGVMFRDMPMRVAVDKKMAAVIDKFPLLQALYEELDNLRLVYGWMDESGSTWKAELPLSEPVQLSPDAWGEFVVVELLGFATTGGGGKLVTSEGTIRVRLPAIDEDLVLEGTFVVNLLDGAKLERIEIEATNPDAIATSKIPGFESIRIRRLSTDFRSATISIELVASQALGKALPVLGGSEPFAASLGVDFSDKDEPSFSLTLPGEMRTNLFGKWEATIRGAQIFLNETSDGARQNRLVLPCSLNLGLPSLESLGARFILVGKGGDWSFDVEPDEVRGSLSIGSFELSGALKWTQLDDNGGNGPFTKAGPVGSKELTGGEQRDFWGTLTLKTDGVLGDGASLFTRVGSKGETSYWVAALIFGDGSGLADDGFAIPLGPAELRRPGLVVAHNANFKTGAGPGLRELVSDVRNAANEKLRPGPSIAEQVKWMENWSPDSTMGTFVAASGYIHFNDYVASTAESADKGEEDEAVDYKTVLAIADGGLFRIEAAGKFFGLSKPARFALAVDLQRPYFSAGFQLPDIKVPPTGTPEFVVSAGFVSFGFGSGDFEFSLGWPRKVKGDAFDRDWSMATRVVWDNLIPINTFWGGMLAAYKNGQFTIGYALKAGFTKTFSIDAVVVKGKAELELSAGGVVVFAINFGQLTAAEHQRTQMGRSLLPSPLDEQQALDAVERGFAAADCTIQVGVEFFADIKGSASVSLFGVELAGVSIHAYSRFKMCGCDFSLTFIGARVGLKFTVKILCVTYSAEANLDVVLRNGDCPGHSLRASELHALHGRP